MRDVYDDVTRLLDERPSVEEALVELLAVDSDGPWTFEEISIDSGTFGELVARGIVEEAGDGYQLANRNAVRAAVDGKEYQPNEENGVLDAWSATAINEAIRRLWRLEQLVAIGGALTLVAIFRLLTFPRIFRPERVVLPGNDPYYYLYWVEQLAMADPAPLAFTTIGEILGGRTTGEPLVYTLGWWATTLGGGVENAPAVVAWLPVIAALLVAIGVYFLGTWTAADERVGVLSVVMFAFLPGHALYSGIGFFDHHAIDYVWLTGLLVGMSWFARAQVRSKGTHGSYLTTPATWGVVAVTAIAVAAMILGWNGSPILITGVAVYAVGRTTSDIRAEWNPMVGMLPVIFALGAGTVLAGIVHLTAGWQEPAVPITFGLVTIGVSILTITAAVSHRMSIQPRWQLIFSTGLAPVLWVGLQRVRPEAAQRLQTRISEALLGREGIAETQGLFTSEIGAFFGPLDHFGWLLFIALPVVGWIGIHCLRNHDPQWLVIGSYTVTLLGFATIQSRFAGAAAVVVAVCAGTGLLWLLSTVELARPFAPFKQRTERTLVQLRAPGITWQRVGYTVGIILVVASLSVFMIPAAMNGVAANDDEVETMAWLDDATNEEDKEYVLTLWGRSRMFNYAVSGESNSYVYARNTYWPFISGTNPGQYADEFQDRVEYIAIYAENGAPPTATYTQLFAENGSATAAANGTGQFQLVHVSSNREIKVFRTVAGAVIAGNTTPNQTVSASARVTAAEANFSYTREVTASSNGTFQLVVAYPGEYTLTAATNTTVTVTSTAVTNGTTVTASSAGSGNLSMKSAAEQG